MARPLRIEYAGAWYHVMNRGARRRVVYPNDRLRIRFLELLEDIHERYGVESHAWCLMDNHYHLLVRTPEPNLGRAMRHVDGVYTQAHNRRLNTDGPLFRGRYVAIVVDSDGYLARLSRYIHYNPVDAGLVDRAERWRWSSYRGYVGRTRPADWFYTDEVLSLFGTRDPRRRYRAFVEQGVDAELCAFYAQSRMPPVLGTPEFRDGLASKVDLADKPNVPDARRVRRRPGLQSIVTATAAAFGLRPEDVLTPTPGRENLPRAVAMSLCQRSGGYPLSVIATAFGLRSISGVATAIGRLDRKRHDPQLDAVMKRLKVRLLQPALSEDSTPEWR